MTAKPRPKPVAKPLTPEQAAAAKAEAEERVRKQVEDNQQEIDAISAGKSDNYKQELFQRLSKMCASATMEKGRIIVSCPIRLNDPKALKKLNCMDPQPKSFDCPNGRGSKGGCLISPTAKKAFTDAKMKIDPSFLSDAEGGGHQVGYVPWWPVSVEKGKAKATSYGSNHSGVTVGTGVDLGAMNEADLTRLQKQGMSKDSADAMRPYLGLKGADACAALRKNGPLKLKSYEDASIVDQDAMLSRAKIVKSSYDRQVKTAEANLDKKIAAETDPRKLAALQAQRASYRSFDELDEREQTVLLSSHYQANDIGKPINPFRDAVMTGDDDGARTALAAKAKLPGAYGSRGAEELQHWDASPPPATGP